MTKIKITFAVWFTTHQSLPGPPDLLYQHLSHLSGGRDLGQSSEAPGTIKLKARMTNRDETCPNMPPNL